MKKLESSFINMTASLTVFAVAIGALLAWVNHVTAKPIKAQEEKALSDGIRNVMGGKDMKIAATDTIRKDAEGKERTLVLYAIKSSDNKNIGTAVECGTQGFGGDLRVLVGFDNRNAILGYTILQSSETPGLGAKADKWFQKDGKGSVIGKSPSTDNMAVRQDGGDIDAITASTITSRAFLKAVRQAYEAVAADTVDGETAASKQTRSATPGAEQRH